MKHTKYRMELFSLFDYRSIEQHLAKMEAKGWRLEKAAGNGLWKYRRCEPANVTYAVTYLPEASAYAPPPAEKQADLVDYCGVSGWEFVTDINQLQIFRNPSQHPTPLETDETLRLKMIRKSMRRGFVPVSIVSLVLCAALLWFLLYFYIKTSFLNLFTTSHVFCVPLFAWAVLLLAGQLLCYLIWLIRSKNRIKHGGKCAETRVLSFIRYGYMIFLALFLVTILDIFLQNSGEGLSAFLTIAIYFLLLTFGGYLYASMRREASDRGSLIVGLLLLSFAITGAKELVSHCLTYWLAPEPEAPVAYVDVYGKTYEVDRYDIPLKAEDLFDTDYANYEYTEWHHGSLLLRHYNAYQMAQADGSHEPTVSYEIYYANLSPLVDLCLQELMEPLDSYYEYREENPAAWGADAVWREYNTQGRSRNSWVLCKDDIVAKFEFRYFDYDDPDLTDAQKAIVGEKLLGDWP